MEPKGATPGAPLIVGAAVMLGDPLDALDTVREPDTEGDEDAKASTNMLFVDISPAPTLMVIIL